jgi:chromosome segregation ATPase
VLQGVALSGGIRRSPVGARIERDIITGRSELKHQAADYSGLLARKARLEAELTDEEEVRFPADLTERADDQAIATLMQRERTLFETRRSAIQNQIRVLKDLQQYLETEVTSVQGQLVTHNRQIELVKKELDAVNTLVSKGLAVEPRRLGLERNVAQLEGDRLRLESSMSRARQEISKTGMTILELSTKRQIDAATGLSETQAKLEEVTRRFETSKGLLHEAEAMAPMVMGDMRTGRVQPVYTIVRQSAGGIATEIIAAETTPVQPGDTIKVDVPVDERPLDRAPDPGRHGKQPS